MKEKLLYEEGYRKHQAKIRDFCLPVVPSAAAGFVVAEAYVEKAGRVQRSDGSELEYQVLRIYFKEAPPGRDTETP